MKRYVFAITGTTGPILGIRLLEELVREAEIHLTISKQSFPIISSETGLDWDGKSEGDIQKKIRKFYSSRRMYYYSEGNLYSPVASGSFKTDGMFVVPCSMKSLSAIANGFADNLIHRAADVTIKEGRKLVLSPRETPYNAIHLENMLKLARIGVAIVPPVIGFYHEPKNVDDMLDFIVGKILDSTGIEHSLFKRWSAKRHSIS